MHPDQLSISVPTVRRLVAAQFPQWRQLPVTVVDSVGTVNAVFRIGDALSARFPIQDDEPLRVLRSLESEAAAGRELLGRTRFATPEPIAIGEAGFDYPLPWSVQSWVPGAVADPGVVGESFALAEDLAELIAGLRAVDTGGRGFDGAGRGGDLMSQDAWVQTCLQNSEQLLDVPRLSALWHDLRCLPGGGRPDVMNHGDLVPGNVLVDRGRLVGVIDVGGFGPADPALDLVAGWHLLAEGPRRLLRSALGSDELEWARGMAWAFAQAIGLVWYYAESNPTVSEVGRRTLDQIRATGP